MNKEHYSIQSNYRWMQSEYIYYLNNYYLHPEWLLFTSRVVIYTTKWLFTLSNSIVLWWLRLHYRNVVKLFFIHHHYLFHRYFYIYNYITTIYFFIIADTYFSFRCTQSNDAAYIIRMQTNSDQTDSHQLNRS